MTPKTPQTTCSECHGPAEIAEHEWAAELLCVPCALELRGRPTRADLAAAESARAEERRRTLEEAALRCDALAEEKDDAACDWCAAAIRALSSAPAPLPSPSTALPEEGWRPRCICENDMSPWHVPDCPRGAYWQGIADGREAVPVATPPAQEKQGPPTPVHLPLWCPFCREPHVDDGEWATRPHHVHLCAQCGREWDALLYSYGVPAATSSSAGPDLVGLLREAQRYLAPHWSEFRARIDAALDRAAAGKESE